MEGKSNSNWQALLLAIEKLVQQGGPEPSQYPSLNALLNAANNDFQDGKISAHEVNQLRNKFKDALSPQTMQGRGATKKYGYSGDFEIIDEIYQHRITDIPHLKRWDEYVQSQPASKAVRNRKSYFIEKLEKLTRSRQSQSLKVLNVASGPCRCLYEFFEKHPFASLFVDCVDADPHAIEFAKQLCEPHIEHFRFHHVNAFKFSTEERYDLVWSAGLFDYFDDETFVNLLARLKQFQLPKTEIIIGNFSTENETRGYMELVGDWYLQHRDPEELVALGAKAGFNPKHIYVEKEPEGVNLFLHCLNE